MKISARLQLLTCLMLYASSAQAIMVKFGTKGGPIEAPTPEPPLPPQPYRNPAPVWEARSEDTPDPNSNWRPSFFVPQLRNTHILESAAVPQVPRPLSNLQRFVKLYIPKKTNPQVQNYNGILSSQTLPGYGLRYFYPAFTNEQVNKSSPDGNDNVIEHDLNQGVDKTDAASEMMWKYEKDNTIRNIRDSQEGTIGGSAYQWPLYVAPQHG